MVYRDCTSTLRLKKSKRLRWMALTEMGKNINVQAIFVLNQKPSSIGSSRMRNVSGWCRYFSYASTATGSLVKCVTTSSIQSASHPSDAGDRRAFASLSTHSYKATTPIIKRVLRAQQFSRLLKTLLFLSSFRHNKWVFFLSYRKKHGGYTLTTQIMVHVRSSSSLSC